MAKHCPITYAIALRAVLPYPKTMLSNKPSESPRGENREWVNTSLSEQGVILYDPEADILVVRIRGAEPRDEELLDNNIVVGLSETGDPVYVEVWHASRRGLLKALAALARKRAAKIEAITKPESS